MPYPLAPSEANPQLDKGLPHSFPSKTLAGASGHKLTTNPIPQISHGRQALPSGLVSSIGASRRHLSILRFALLVPISHPRRPSIPSPISPAAGHDRHHTTTRSTPSADSTSRHTGPVSLASHPPHSQSPAQHTLHQPRTRTRPTIGACGITSGAETTLFRSDVFP